jgi:hypothetical protein
MASKGEVASVELVASDAGADLVSYALEVVTSDMRGAGTDSSVWIELHGELVGMWVANTISFSPPTSRG